MGAQASRLATTAGVHASHHLRPGVRAATELWGGPAGARALSSGRYHPGGPWWDRLEAVRAFVAQHGWVPRQTPGRAKTPLPGEVQLGKWLNSQRQRHRGNKGYGDPLSVAQQAALEATPGWCWGATRAQQWVRRCEEVAAFARQHGHLPRRLGAPRKPLLAREQELGEWCHTQRQTHKGQGTCTPLGSEQVAALEAIPGWHWQPLVERWEDNCAAVLAFRHQHGRLPRMKGSQQVPLAEGEKQLAHWCNNQRQAQRGRRGCAPLSAEQVAALEAIPGWQWLPFVERWEDSCAAVLTFRHQHGRLPRTVGSQQLPLAEGEKQFGVWCQTQRNARRGQGMLAELGAEQVAKLEAIPGWRWEALWSSM